MTQTMGKKSKSSGMETKNLFQKTGKNSWKKIGTVRVPKNSMVIMSAKKKIVPKKKGKKKKKRKR